MRTESQLIQMIQRAGSLAEQGALVAELDALKASQRTASRQDSEIDFADTMVQASQTPVLVHTMHTAATDWLDDVMTVEADLRTATNAMAAEASLWFARTSEAVRQDHEEFEEQAVGMARRLAGKYGEQAPAAAQAFLDYAAFLHRREAASGLDQVQQITAPDGVTERRTPLNEEVFDTFGQPIDPMNVGIDEMQTTENAPLLNEILAEGQGEGQAEVPGGHMDSQVFNGPQTDGTGNPVMRQGSLVDAPSVALGYTMNLDDFRRQAAGNCTVEGCDNSKAFEKGEDANDWGMCEKHARQKSNKERLGSRHPFVSEAQVGEPYSSQPHINKSVNEQQFKDAYDAHGLQEEEWGNHYEGGEDAARNSVNQSKDDHGKHGQRVVVSRVEAASGLPQVGQVMDSQENIDPQAFPQDVAFPIVGLPEPQNTQGTGEAMPAEPLPGQGQGPQRQGRKVASTGSVDYRKGFGFAANWQPDMPLVKKGSAEFEAGLFEGMRENTEDSQIAWIERHEARGGVFARRISLARKAAKTVVANGATNGSELEEMDAGLPSPTPDTPFSGKGQPGPLDGGMDAAAPGGAAPYNGAAPFSAPVTPQPVINNAPAPADAGTDGAQQRWAFRQRVQAGLLAEVKS